MKGTKYLARNVGLLTISQFGTKLLSLFLLPLYTNVLSTTEYGTYDLFNSTVLLLIPILTMNICDSSLRFSIDEKSDNKQIFSISMFHFAISILILAVAMGINKVLNIFPIVNDYAIMFFWLFAGTALNGILSYYARGIDCVKEVSVSGVICSVTMLTLNVLFLLPLHMGVTGYFLANILGVSSQVIYLFIAIKGWKHFTMQKVSPVLHKKMLEYSKPMIINNVAWWVNNVSDRYIVTWLCGVAANGIYSVSYKIPSILMIFQSIFNQAWTLSAVKDFDPKDENGFFINMYNSYNICMTVICSLLIAASRVVAKLLYAKDFFVAWQYVPFLLISVVFGALAGYLGGIFGAVKDTKVFAQSTLISAVVNTILNIVLVARIGVIGASIATAIAYMITWLIRLIKVRKYIRLKIDWKRDITAYCILIIQSLMLYIFNESLVYYIIEVVLITLLLLVYKKQIKKIFNKLIKVVGGKLGHE